MIQTGTSSVNPSAQWKSFSDSQMIELQHEIRFEERFDSIPSVDFELRVPSPMPYITIGYNKTIMVTCDSFFVRLKVHENTKIPINIEIHWNAMN